MASTKKFTHSAMSDQNGHVDREHDQPSNTDIDPERTHLNYSFPMSHDGIKPYQYYKQRIGEVYMYGRGSRREKEAVTGCGWIVTLPKEIYGDSEKEKAFFKGVYEFIENRYGKENIINNSVHYDEGGLPHIHVIFSPVTKLDHEVVQYKTKRTNQAVKLESGRYEYKYIHVDKNGRPVDEKNPDTWVKLNNYARMSDYYDEKVDCNSVLNKIELRNFHPDLQKYLTENGIEGKVVTGKTGTNFTVKELKEFTAKTGLHLDEVKEMMQDDKSLLQSFVEKDARVVQLEEAVHQKDAVIEALKEEILSRDKTIDRMDRSEEISHKKDEQIRDLTHTISEKNKELARATDRNAELEKKLAEMEKTIEAKQGELERAQSRVEELEKQKTVEVSQTDRTQGWGQSTSSWGDRSQSGWGTKTTSIEEEKTW